MKRARLVEGDCLAPFSVRTVSGVELQLPDGNRRTHLRFLRWAGCSICELQTVEYRQRAAEIERAGVHEVIFYHSSLQDTAEFHRDTPFDLVADPEKFFYRRFGVGSSLLFLARRRTLRALRESQEVRSNLKMTNGPFSLPADLLIAPNGTVLDAHYGRFADDSWSVDELLERAGAWHGDVATVVDRAAEVLLRSMEVTR